MYWWHCQNISPENNAIMDPQASSSLKDPPNYLKQTGTSGQPASGGQPWVTSGGPLNATAASTWTALATCYNPLAALFTVFLVLSLLSDNIFCVLSSVFLK